MYGVEFQTQQDQAVLGTISLVIGEGNEQQEDEQKPKKQQQPQEQQPQEEQEVSMKALKGHRKEVPAQIFRKYSCIWSALCSINCVTINLFDLLAVPADFLDWPRRKQINHVCQERMKILRPDKFQHQTSLSSHRSKITSRRKTIRNYTLRAEKYVKRAAKEHVSTK